MKKNDEGFTLVELLIVIVILGILATVVVFAVQGITDDSRQNSCDVGQRTVQTAVEAYYAEAGEFPTAIADLNEFLRDGSGADDWAIVNTANTSGMVSAVADTSCDGLVSTG